MANPIVRKLFRNLPPKGHGVYARNQSIDWLAQFDFVLVHAGRGDAADTARALRQRGKEVWFYGLPANWQPTDDETAFIATIERLCDATGGVGGLTNTENGWPSAPQSRAQEFAANIKASIGRGYRWGMNFYPEMKWRAEMADSGAWMSPSYFHPQDPRFDSEYRLLFGPLMVIPSVPLWPRIEAPPAVSYDAESYDALLAGIPHSVGAIGFPAATEGNAWMTDAYKAWKPWGNAGMLALLDVERVASMPATWAALVVLLVVAVLLYSERS